MSLQIQIRKDRFDKKALKKSGRRDLEKQICKDKFEKKNLKRKIWIYGPSKIDLQR